MGTNMKFKIFFLAASVAGVLFSGYLSAVKLFSSTCAFGETCPLFFGYPACYFGFVLFVLLLILSVLLWLGKCSVKSLANTLLIVSFAGVLFAGYFSIGEIPLLLQRGFGAYVFGLPTCVMGSIFFIMIFIASIMFKRISPRTFQEK
jgi:uncharacterized membrane protein